MQGKHIAIITARSGSKGIRDKNIRNLSGRPLMAYSIEAALQSEIFDVVMVSTDSKEYADIAVMYGAEVPFLRSLECSRDESDSWDTVKEVLINYENIQKRTFDTFCVLQPTSPLRKKDDIIKAYRLYREKKAKAIVSVCEVDYSPYWCNRLPKDLSLNNFISKESDRQRQKMEQFYRLNGAIYISETKDFWSDSNLYKEGSFAYIMDRQSSVDIDTEYDFAIAELMIQKRQ